MQTPWIPHCVTCDSQHVEPLPRIMRNDAEDWFQCDRCGHVFTASAVMEDSDALGKSPDIFSVSELSSDERARVASVAGQRFAP